MKKLRDSFSYAIRGIAYCITSQQNLRIHIAAIIAVVALGFWLKVTNGEWYAILLCCAMVLTAEMINTAIEKLCDVVHPAPHPKIKIIKDVAAGAVLVTAIAAAICGGIIFFLNSVNYCKMKLLSKFDQLLWRLLTFVGILIVARILYSGSITSLFLVWNIFLAWIPYVLSRFLWLTGKSKNGNNLFCWVHGYCFFPMPFI